MQVRHLSLVAVSLIITLSAMAADFAVYDSVVFDNVTMPVNTTNTSREIDMNEFKPTGWTFSIQLGSTNQGTLAIAYQLSNGDGLWSKTSNIVTGFSVTNGASLYQFTTERARFMRLRAITTGTNANLTGRLVLQ